MKWHRFNLDEEKEEIDWECWRWTDVMPGDVVQSKGTMAWKREDFLHRHEEGTRYIRLAGNSPLLVLSRIAGVPGEDKSLKKTHVTFTCLCRYGLVIVLGDLEFGKSDNEK